MMGQQPRCPITLSFFPSAFAQIRAGIFLFAPFRAVITHAQPTKSVISPVFSVILNWHRNCYLLGKVNKEMFVVVTRVFQQTFLKMHRFAFTLHFAFIASILLAGCTAPAHLRHRPHPSTSELSSEEKMQQTVDAWKGTHISKAVQKWGSPNEVSDDGTGWQIYVWQIPVLRYLGNQEHRMIPRPGQRRPSRQDLGGLRQGVGRAYLSTDYAYEITFYTRPNGIIYKTLAKKNHDAASELYWK